MKLASSCFARKSAGQNARSVLGYLRGVRAVAEVSTGKRTPGETSPAGTFLQERVPRDSCAWLPARAHSRRLVCRRRSSRFHFLPVHAAVLPAWEEACHQSRREKSSLFLPARTFPG